MVLNADGIPVVAITGAGSTVIEKDTGAPVQPPPGIIKFPVA